MNHFIDRWCDRSDRLPLALLIVFFFVVAVAGGASRADVLGQVVVRAAAVLLMIALVATRAKLDLATYGPVVLILACCAMLIVVQLVPLPPAIWSNLPGRAMFVSATQDAGLATPWRPIAIYPDGAINALFSLLVPAATLLGIAALGPRGVRMLLPILLVWAIANAVLILLQASGEWFSNPFINDGDRQFGGFFPNRNHGALFLAIGTVCAAFWGFSSRRRTRSRVLLAVGLVTLLLLTSLATGSRSGLVCEAVALFFGLMTTRALEIGRARSDRTMRILAGVGAVILVAAAIGISLSFDRALSLGRAFDLGTLDDVRVLAAPAVWDAVKTYFPFGSGAGSFDHAFRIVEPLTFLDTTYMNHAHDDFLEIPLEYGLIGILVVAGAVFWAVRRAFAVWRLPSASELALPRTGSIIVGLVLIAAATDYAARTPIMMTVLTIAGASLCARHLAVGDDIVDRVALRHAAPSL